MAGAATYQAQAGTIYDPQASAESTQAKSARDSQVSDITAAKSELQPYYAKALSSLQVGEDNAHGHQAAADNLAGLLDSGLHQNQDANITHTYAADRTNLQDEEATKAANYDRQAANVDSSYQSALSAILDKYNGMKAAYVNNGLQADENRAFQEKMQAQSDALQRESMQLNAGISNRQLALEEAQANKPSAGQELYDTISKAFQGFGARKTGYTEATILPAIKAQALKLGIDPNQAVDATYSYRKALYGG